jgi:hypothetical protein
MYAPAGAANGRLPFAVAVTAVTVTGRAAVVRRLGASSGAAPNAAISRRLTGARTMPATSASTELAGPLKTP